MVERAGAIGIDMADVVELEHWTSIYGGRRRRFRSGGLRSRTATARRQH